MLVSTKLLQPLIEVQTPISSSTVEKVKKLVMENPDKISLLQVLNCFGDFLYKNNFTATPKKRVLDNIIQQFLGITHAELVKDFKKLKEFVPDEWITFRYFMKEQSRNHILQWTTERDSLAIINPILQMFYEQNRLSPENRKIISKFLESGLSFIRDKHISFPKNFWIYCFGSSKIESIKTMDPISIYNIGDRCSTLSSEASFTAIHDLLEKSLHFNNEQYRAVIACVNKYKNFYPRDYVLLVDTCISLQQVGSLSLVERCFRLGALPQFMKILPHLEITPDIGKFSDENLVFLIQYHMQMRPYEQPRLKKRYSLQQYASLLEPVEKNPLDLADIPYLNSLAFFQTLDWDTFYNETIRSNTPRDVLKLLINLQYNIKKSGKFLSNAPIRIFQRNNLISKYFPEYSHTAVLEAIELACFMGDTSYFAIQLLLVQEGLHSYLHEFGDYQLSEPKELTKELLLLKKEGNLNPQFLRTMLSETDPSFRLTREKLTSYKNQHPHFNLLCKKYHHLTLPQDKQYTVYQCLEKLDEITYQSILNTWKLFESSTPQPTPQAISSLTMLLESLVTTNRKPVIYNREWKVFELVLMQLLVANFFEKKVSLEDSYQKLNNIENCDQFGDDLYAQWMNHNNQNLLVSSRELLKELPTAGPSATIDELYSLLKSKPFVSLLSIFHCFDAILMQKKGLIQLTAKWEILELLTQKYLGMPQETLADELKALFTREITPSEQIKKIDDWLKICYFTRDVHLQRESLLSLMRYPLPDIYEILKILSVIDEISDENVAFLHLQLYRDPSLGFFKEMSPIKEMSPANFCYHLDLVSRPVGGQDIKERYETLPDCDLETKHKLLHRDEASYQELLRLWTQTKKNPGYPPFTKSEEKKCFKIFMRMSELDCLALFERCLRLEYLKKFTMAFNAQDIDKNFEMFSDENLVCFIDYYSTHPYDVREGLSVINLLLPSQKEDFNNLDLVSDLHSLMDRGQLSTNKHLLFLIKELKVEKPFLSAVVRIENALILDKSDYNRVFLTILRNKLVEKIFPSHSYYEQALNLAALTRALGRNLASSIFEIHVCLLATRSRVSFNQDFCEKLISNHDSIRRQVLALYVNKKLNADTFMAIMNQLPSSEQVSREISSHAKALDAILENSKGTKAPRSELAKRDRFFALCPQGPLTQKKIDQLENYFFPL